LLERALDGELEQPFDVGVADRLSEAYERLALLVCISLVRSAARAFSASPRRPRRSRTTQ
jgi:hypothetical protein